MATLYVGTWVPGWADLGRFLVGLLLGYAYVLPEYVQYNRMCDEYVRGLLEGRFEFGSAWRRSGWFLLGRVLWWSLYLTAINLRGPYPSVLVGDFLGMAAWNGFMVQLWKRMWELHELDQQKSIPQAAGEAPAPRVEG
jgi:hypothetical protein